MKALAADVKAFLYDPALWDQPSEGAWYVDDDVDFDAMFADLTVKVEVDAWPIAWQGGGMGEPPEGLGHPFVRNNSFLAQFKRWAKGRTHKTVAVTIPVGDVDLLTKLCASHKWKMGGVT